MDGQEVDFVVTSNKKPQLFVECKWDDAPLSPSLKYLKQRFKDCDAWQISAIGTKDYQVEMNIRVCQANELLKTLV